MTAPADETGQITHIGPTTWPRLSRRDFMRVVSGAGVAVLALRYGLGEGYAYASDPLGSTFTPEQIHLTWGADPSSEVTVSWATALAPTSSSNPQVTISPPAPGSSRTLVERSYVDGLSGETVYCYHITISGLGPSTTYAYTISDEADTTVTFSSTFTTAGTGRFAFAFTSFGDLATPGAGATYTLPDGSTVGSTTYSESQWNAYNAVGEVEMLAPLFHLLNGDLAYADKETINSSGVTHPASSTVQPAPEVWRDFFLNMQRSAMNRPWMPCIGNHEAELDNGPYGYSSYNTRFMLPTNGTSSFEGSFYSFQVGSVLFISLDANDVCYQGAGAYNVGGVATADAAGNPISASAHQYNQFYTGTFTTNADGTMSPGGPNPNAQTTWLEQTLASARASTTVDWIVVQMHQSALSSSTDNGCDAGIRQMWVPLFDQYQVDLVVNGHDHDYERSWPVRGFTPNQGTSTFAGGTVTQASGPVTLPSTKNETVNTFTPNVVSTDETSPFDTTKGTVYMVLGGGGTNKRDNTYATTANVTTFTQIRTGAKPAPDATEPATWSAMTDATDAYGIAYFAVDPGQPGGNTTITVTYYHAPTQSSSTSTPSYSQLESFQLTRPRNDNIPPVLPEFPVPALAVGGALVLGAGALLVSQQHRSTQTAKRLELVQTPGPGDH